MKLGNILNNERLSALHTDRNAYVSVYKSDKGKTQTQTVEKVLFPQEYENASPHYNMNNFSRPQNDNQENIQHNQHSNQSNNSFHTMFDMKSILPMLMSGKFNDMLKPLMSMFGGNGGGTGGFDIAKIFELFKPKSKTKKEEKKEEDISSKFDDFIIIED